MGQKDEDVIDRIKQAAAPKSETAADAGEIPPGYEEEAKASQAAVASTSTGLPDRVLELEKESAENRDKWMRTAAELENYRKRAVQERSKLLKYRNEELLRDLLPVLDNFERALSWSGDAEDSNPVTEGVRIISKLLMETMERYGVKGFSSLGEPFDPNVHEALSKIPMADKEPNTVIEELEKGYMYNDRLLRPAKVVVSAPHPSEMN
ncbi:MAG: nucleotide exchange factor GrpE [Pseudomonadota bacterium]